MARPTAVPSTSQGGAPPVAVVASGLDVVYPRRHRALWEDVATRGSLLSECPLGTAPEAWRFPARNRIIAALADAVVVVESAGAGGSMYTVEEALAATGRSWRSRARCDRQPRPAPTGCWPRGPAWPATPTTCWPPSGSPSARPRAACGPAPEPVGPEGAVLRSLQDGPGTLESLAATTGLALGPLSVAVASLEASGRVSRHGLWLERSEPVR